MGSIRLGSMVALLGTSAALAAACNGASTTGASNATTATVTATVTVIETVTATPSGAPTPTLADGTYNLANAGLTSDGCGFGATFSYWAAETSGAVTTTTGSFNLDMGDYLAAYQETGTALFDVGSPGLASFICNVPDANGDFACGPDPAVSYDAALGQNIVYGGTITGTNKFTVRDDYQLSCDGPDCATLAADSGLTALPCETIDGGDFAKQ